MATRHPITLKEVTIGCRVQRFRSRKKNISMDEVVDLDAIFGGDAMTRGRVSKIDVREGTIGLPVIVVSQYLRFYNLLAAEHGH